MSPRQLIPLFILALASCNGDRPDTIKIIAIERLSNVPIPALSNLRAHDPVALSIRIKSEDVSDVVALASRIEFFVFPCGREFGRSYVAELYGDGVPLGPNWRYDNFDPPTPRPKATTLIAFVQRRAFDEGHDCGRFMEIEDVEGSTSVYVISNTVRISGVPAAGAASTTNP